MDLSSLGVAAVTGVGGVGIEPLIEHAVMQYIPASLNFTKPIISWLISAAYGIGQTYILGGDWRSAVVSTVTTALTMELKHQSSWGSSATPVPSAQSTPAAGQ